MTPSVRLSEERWLDTHYAACRPEYEALFRSVPFARGSRLLDAGAGSGSFLPLLAEAAGEDGEVVAIDGDSDLVSAMRARSLSRPIGRITVERASVIDLPFPTGSFDGAWCSQVLQYLGDEDVTAALSELRRVVRPGGVIAVKDSDMLLTSVHPADPLIFARLADVCARSDPSPQSRGSVRGRQLRRWLERAGLVEVQQRSVLIERWAPLRSEERQLYAEWLTYLARRADEVPVDQADRDAWHALVEERVVDRDDFYACEGQSLAIGRVPDTTDSRRPRTMSSDTTAATKVA